MTKVLLLQAAIHDEHIERSQPLGLMYLASYLREHGDFQPVIHDMRLTYQRPDLAEEVIRSERPDIVGISAQSPDAPVMHALAAMVKKHAPRVPVIAGGVHISSYPEDTIKNDANIDFGVPGEGEITFFELCRALAGGDDGRQVPGVVYCENGNVERAPERPIAKDPDVIPYPAWDLIDLDAYGRLPRIGLIYAHPRYMIVETARACPFDCAWCHKTAGNIHRMHSPEYVINEIATLLERHKVGEITIIDDMFNADIDRVNAIFHGLIERKLNIAISIVNGLRADMLPDETLELMKKAGVYRVMYAIETASARQQRLMRKNLDFAKVKRAIEKTYRLGILIHGNFIIGLPGETGDEVKHTVRFAASSKIDTIGLYRAIPYKGCDLYRIALEQGIDLPTGEMTYSFWDAEVNLSRVPVKRLNQYKKRAYWQTYLRPRRIFRLLTLMPNKTRLIPFLFRFFLRKAFRDN